MSDDPVLWCRDVHKHHFDGDRKITVLNGVVFELYPGQTCSIVGASGSGKSTLLNILGGLDKPSSGVVEIAGERIGTLAEQPLCRLRNRRLGFVYQFHHLLGEFTAAENVAMPLLIGGLKRNPALRQAEQLLDRVGMSHRTGHKPAQLSGGERQRVAIARSLIAGPACVLMDEPTGNLDPQSARQVLQLLESLTRASDTAFVIVTHNPEIAARMQRNLTLEQGRLVESPA